MTNFSGKYKDTYSNCPKNQKLPEILQAGGASAPPDPPLPTPMSTAECVHGFCVLNDICTQERNRICMITCNAALFINVNGPPLSQVDFGKYVHEWIKKHRSATSQDLRNRL